MIKVMAQIIVGGSAVYHILMGIACWLGVERVNKLTSFFYKVNLPSGDSMDYAIKPIGAFAVWTGFICAVAWWRGGEFFYFVSIGLIGLFLARGFFRWFHQDLFLKNYGVDWKRSRWNVLFNILLSTALLVDVLLNS